MDDVSIPVRSSTTDKCTDAYDRRDAHGSEGLVADVRRLWRSGATRSYRYSTALSDDCFVATAQESIAATGGISNAAATGFGWPSTKRAAPQPQD